MANKLVIRNSVVAGRRPAPRSGKPGELWANITDKVLGSYDAAGNAIILGASSPHGVVPFDATKAYNTDDLVTNAGKIYRAKAGVAVGVWDPTQWEDININTAHGVRPFGQPATYAVNDLVSYGGRIYRAVLANSATAWNANQWEDITTQVDAVRAFSPSVSYAASDLVARGGRIYRAKGIVPPAAWNAAQWDDISLASDAITAFDPSRTYSAGALVTQGSKIYAAKTAFGPAAWDATKWDCITTTTGGLTYIGTLDCTVAYVASATPLGIGSFLTNTGTGAMHASWTAVTSNPPATVAPGDTMVWDGTKFHHNVGQLSTLSAATATALGGVFATVNPGTTAAPQFVNGISATGALTYAVAGDAYLDATQSWTKAQRGTPVAGTGAFDFALANNFTIAGAGAAVTVANPTNVVAGQSGAIVIDNAASVAFGTSFKFEGGTAPTGSGAGKKDVLVYYVISATEIAAKLVKGV